MSRPARSCQRGFTIVELMLATLVFSAILVVVTVGVMRFTHSYYAGITQANTQTTARQTIDDIAQAIQFSGTPVATSLAQNGAARGFCVGGIRYSYILGKQLTDGSPSSDQSKHVLVSDKVPLCSGQPAQNIANSVASGSKELLAPNMRLAKLSIAKVASGGVYQINLRLVYGDADLLNNPSGTNASCKSGVASSQYCAVSELTTTVIKRVNPDE